MSKEDAFITGLRGYFAANPNVKPATVSDRAGLNKSAIRKLLDGHVASPRHASMDAIASALGLTIADIVSGNFSGSSGQRASTGFAEGQAVPFRHRNSDDARILAEILAPDARKPETYVVQRGSASFGLMPGDVIYIDLGRSPREGDVVLVNHRDPETMQVSARFYRFASPWLVGEATDSQPIVNLDSANEDWGVLGPICAVARGAGLSRY